MHFDGVPIGPSLIYFFIVSLYIHFEQFFTLNDLAGNFVMCICRRFNDVDPTLSDRLYNHNKIILFLIKITHRKWVAHLVNDNN